MTALSTAGTAIPSNLTLRWTMGDVHPRGFELLRLSITCAAHLFGPHATYRVYVNSLDVDVAQQRTGSLPIPVLWSQASRRDLAPAILPFLTEHLIEGMGWKLAPFRTDPTHFELALDNDCILWGIPSGIRAWFQDPASVLFAEDVERFLGSFDALCPAGNFNAGIRGLPPGIDLSAEMRAVLQDLQALHGPSFRITEEIDEQGLQAAAIFRCPRVHLVSKEEVSICSPFWPRSPNFGTCGAHFVGLNAHHIPWSYFDRPADLCLEEHWQRHRAALYTQAKLPLPPT